MAKLSEEFVHLLINKLLLNVYKTKNVNICKNKLLQFRKSIKNVECD